MTTLDLYRRRFKLALMQNGADDRSPVVLLATIIAGTVVALGLLAVLAVAILTGHGTDALVAAGVTVVGAYLNSIHSKVSNQPPADRPAVNPAPPSTSDGG